MDKDDLTLILLLGLFFIITVLAYLVKDYKEKQFEKKLHCSVVALFSNMIRCDNENIVYEEIAVAHDYFEKRFKYPNKLQDLLSQNLKEKKIP